MEWKGQRQHIVGCGDEETVVVWEVTFLHCREHRIRLAQRTYTYCVEGDKEAAEL